MKREVKRAMIPLEKRIVLKVNPLELRSGIVLPKIRYQVEAVVEEGEVYTGMVLPMPRVLMYYLTGKELLVATLIIDKSIETGECDMSVKEMSKYLKISAPAVSNILYSLKKCGLLLEKPNGRAGSGRTRHIDYRAVQHLNDLAEDENPSIYIRIRRATQKRNIFSLTKEDVLEAYDNYALPYDHDVAEEEEYD